MRTQSRPIDVPDRKAKPLGAAALGVLAMIAVGLVIGIAACGSTVHGASHPAAAGTGQGQEPTAASTSPGVLLCAATQTVDRLLVGPMSSHVRELLPRGITIADVRQVRALAAALCALPLMPPGVHCPAASGGEVLLRFTAGGQAFPVVRIQNSGCRTVTGVGPTRWWSESPQFGMLLSRTVGGRGRLMPGMHPSSVPTA
jgi:hypothetical protein